MKIVERAVLAVLALAFVFALHQGVGAMMERHQWKGLSPSDWAAWVQAVGSITALGVAIYVMSKQNEYARRLMIDSDKLALLRRASSVHAIIRRARIQVAHTHRILTTTAATPEERARAQGQLYIAGNILTEMRNTIATIPTHELGSYEMAEGVLRFGELLRTYSATIAAVAPDNAVVGNAHAAVLSEGVCNQINAAVALFERGMDALK